MRIVTVEEMRKIENEAQKKHGYSEHLIMENVGHEGAHLIHEKFLSNKSYGEIVILVGKGHNGADGLAIGRHLRRFGHSVRAFLLFSEGDGALAFKNQLQLARSFGVKISEIRDVEQISSYFSQTQDEYFVIDAILGTGVHLPLPNYISDVIAIANEYASTMVAVDIPTGLTGNTGAVSGGAIQANMTLAIGLPKLGHYVANGPVYTGEICVADGGLPPELLQGGDKKLVSSQSVVSYLKGRSIFAHKNTFGHCLVLGGSHGLTGALILSSLSALRVGTGLVTAVTWPESYPELVSRVPFEIMTGQIPEDELDIDNILKKLDRYNSIVIGPGLGRSSRARDAVVEVLSHFSGPVVVDADAINVLSLSEDGHVFARRKGPTLFTPHIGEFARFTGIPKEKILEKPIDYLKQLVDATNAAILLKGPSTFLALPNGEISIHYSPNAGLATGGSGDVLAGVIGGLFAQRSSDKWVHDPLKQNQTFFDSISLGVVLHSIAGKLATEKYGDRSMMASALIEFFPKAFDELERLL